MLRRAFLSLIVVNLGWAAIHAGFITPATYTYDFEGPVSMAVGDFDGDGIPDLAVANLGRYTVNNGYVWILLGKGDGTFQAATKHQAGVVPTFVVVGDLNGDGKADLVVINPGGRTPGGVNVLLGNGDGGFRAARSYDAGPSPEYLAVGDFNGDGIPDLAVSGGSVVSILAGNGDGSFQPPLTYATGGAGFVAVGDFNGDGKLDLALANGSNTVGILMGNGDGTFQSAQNYPVGTGPAWLIVGDFNGDGIPDLGVANSGTYPDYQGTVSLLLGKGDGSFQPAQNLGVGMMACSLTVGDFNSDGNLDLAVTNQGSGTVSVLLGNGDGSFRVPVTNTAGSSPISIVVAPSRTDGHLDLAVLNEFANSVSILSGKGDGTFQGIPTYPVGAFPYSVAVGDFNGDGHRDLAVADNGYPNAGGVSILLGEGDGTFQAGRYFALPFEASSITVGDFNGDGVSDLAVAGSDDPDYGYVGILLGKGDGTFQTAQTYAAGADAFSVIVADFNGDGVPDLAVGNHDDRMASVIIMLGKGDGTFLPGRETVLGDSLNFSFAVGDFNGDGFADLAVVDPNAYPRGRMSILLGKGDGTFLAPQTYAAVSDPYSVAAADFNGDGHLDLAVSANEGVVVFLGHGDGTFQPIQSSPPIGYLAVADFNADGIPDLAGIYGDLGGVNILLGKGDGTFRSHQEYAAGPFPYSLAVGDFNGDGFPDIVVSNFGDTVTILLNAADWGEHPPVPPR
jgi:hypothetical protein